MKIIRGAIVAAVFSAALCLCASSQAFVLNDIGILGGDPKSLESVPNHGTWFGSFYTAETCFFEAVDVSNKGGVNVLTGWCEVRGTGPGQHNDPVLHPRRLVAPKTFVEWIACGRSAITQPM